MAVIVMEMVEKQLACDLCGWWEHHWRFGSHSEGVALVRVDTGRSLHHLVPSSFLAVPPRPSLSVRWFLSPVFHPYNYIPRDFGYYHSVEKERCDLRQSVRSLVEGK